MTRLSSKRIPVHRKSSEAYRGRFVGALVVALTLVGLAALRVDLAPNGSLVVTRQASRGFLDWYTVALQATGVVRWEAVRDGGLNTDEIPRGVLVLADGTTVVTGRGGPNLPGGFIPGVTAGYSANGTLRWEAFSRMETVWSIGLTSGDVCASGGYDALITCWRVPRLNS